MPLSSVSLADLLAQIADLTAEALLRRIQDLPTHHQSRLPLGNSDVPAELTVAQVAARLQVSTKTVNSYLRKKLIVGSNLNNGQGRPLWRVSPAAVEKYMAERELPS